MSVEAYTWALNLAPVPMDTGGKLPKPNSACAFVLVALANHAGPDGRDAFPSVPTLMRYTRLAERTVRTALDRLEADGIIRASDPDIVAAKIKRADRRPRGYDLAMELMRDDLDDDELDEIGRQNPWLKPWIDEHRPATAAPRERGAAVAGRKRRGAAAATNGVQPTTARGAAAAPKPSIEPSLNQPTTVEPVSADVEALITAVMDGLGSSALKRATQRPGLAGACEHARSLGWTPATLTAWVKGENWTGAGPGAVVHRLRNLEPAAPRPTPPRPTPCPIHPGQPTGRCDDCDRGIRPTPQISARELLGRPRRPR